MKKLIVLFILVVIVITGVIIMNTKSAATKVPYNNGFYSGPYNPKLPVIKP